MISIFYLCLSTYFLSGDAQTVVNGQIFTNGLSIVDSPAVNSTQHAGSVMPIAIDVSGDGSIPQDALSPQSNKNPHYDSLEVFLVSSTTSSNFTIANTTTGLLSQENGSTVKHINFWVPSCVKSGNYNVTIYEGSHINGTAYYSITPIPISIQNTNTNGDCSNITNNLQSQPQGSSPPAVNPFLAANGSQVVFPQNGACAASSRASLPVAIALAALGLFVILWTRWGVRQKQDRCNEFFDMWCELSRSSSSRIIPSDSHFTLPSI